MRSRERDRICETSGTVPIVSLHRRARRSATSRPAILVTQYRVRLITQCRSADALARSAVGFGFDGSAHLGRGEFRCHPGAWARGRGSRPRDVCPGHDGLLPDPGRSRIADHHALHHLRSAPPRRQRIFSIRAPLYAKARFGPSASASSRRRLPYSCTRFLETAASPGSLVLSRWRPHSACSANLDDATCLPTCKLRAWWR